MKTSKKKNKLEVNFDKQKYFFDYGIVASFGKKVEGYGFGFCLTVKFHQYTLSVLTKDYIPF